MRLRWKEGITVQEHVEEAATKFGRKRECEESELPYVFEVVNLQLYSDRKEADCLVVILPMAETEEC